ncbi:MAG: Gfo/Idh/MocA family oxidoreductase [Lentisphaeria bacterium]|nr:Gfo/Idh/MocA family oxidoreductase [Lentisphaeria bacterium]
MEKIRMGVVGLGHRGRHMFKLAAEAFPDQVIPAAACDIISSNWTETKWLQTRPMGEIFPEAKFYTDFSAMLAEAELDAVIIETGADIHAQFCADALKAGVNVLSDIPVVATVEEAEMLWKVHKESKAMFSTGANANKTRYSRMMRELCKAGLLGKPYYMESEYVTGQHWEDKAYSKGLTENGDWRKLLCPIRYCTHSLGPFLAFMDEDLRKVSCFGTGPQAPIEEYHGFPKDDVQTAQFQTDSGVVIKLLRTGRCRAKIGSHNYRIFGTEGYFESQSERGKQGQIIRYNSTKYYPASELVEQEGGYMPYECIHNPAATGHGGADYVILEEFINALLTGGESPISLREGLRMTLPGIYAEMSAKQGGKLLEIKYPWDNE